ncbi:ABC transporter ATP-binding protein [Hyphomicrobium sp. CS1BSMeth3]|uniref:ABC transporter ATP-binding protein n=1 Tax=Hyphomicrobium sp. CS1BSMeth3 TaxID=1892844 RepID=UPI001FCD1CCF|nr:ABC transporter ATP-binding protein [Hyphomicrobium sp. CS1BSMeth3]
MQDEVAKTAGVGPGAEVAPQRHGSSGSPVLSIENLHVHFVTENGTVRAVEGLSYAVAPGEIVAIVGESGSGKSVSALAVMQLLPPNTARIVDGSVRFEGRELLNLDEEEMRRIRGREISMIFQEPMTSLNPVLTIGLQIMEPLLMHLEMSDEEAKARAIELLTLVGITDPESRLEQYPHQLSGGMRQRVMIAIGLACNPKLLIADEPTTALDVTIQAQILELMKDLSRRLGIAVIIITHNLGIVARYADRVNVMYAARLIETGPAEAVFGHPIHPYARGLLAAVPRLDRGRASQLTTIEGAPPNLLDPPEGCRFRPRCRYGIDKCAHVPALAEIERGHFAACHRAGEIDALEKASQKADAGELQTGAAEKGDPILRINHTLKFFPVGGGFLRGPARQVKAVNDVSLHIMPGETLGLVGESGCGKSTLGRLVLRLDDPTGGEILFAGTDLAALSRAEMTGVRKKMQVIFQDPYSSLNPRMTVGQIIGEPMRVHDIVPKAKVPDRIAELLQLVGLFPYMALRYPHELSGGQRQRVGIARALAVEPDVIVCDEAVSALDVSIQGQVINLLEHLQRKLGLTYLFIAHDLAVVRHISSRVAVMYLGRIVEQASSDELFANPKHPYTQALLAAAPVPDPVIERTRPRTIITGELPSPLNPPPGCVFHPRCPKATAECKKAVPDTRELVSGHTVACIHA